MLEELTLSDIESFEEVEIETTYDLTIEGNSNYFIYSGKPILVHNSGKTWSAIDFIMSVALLSKQPLTINIVKETYSGFKTTLYNDFRTMYPGALPFDTQKEVTQFDVGKAKVFFMGADQPSKYHGAGCDIFYINEALTISQSIFDQLEMRCSRFWIMDYNPSVSDHWIFNKLGKRDDVVFVHSTMLDNPHIGKWEKKKILSYEPTPANIASGTADDFMWTVYGLGLRASPQGLIFRDVTWIDEFPDDVDQIGYAIDFGYTNSPCCIGKTGKSGRNLYAQKLFYQPIDNARDLSEIIIKLIGDNYITADSADPGMISELRRYGVNVIPARKFPGSIKWGIDVIKQHKLHLVRDADVRREQENYKWREINGISLNEPIDDYNHFFDQLRYCVCASFRTD